MKARNRRRKSGYDKRRQTKIIIIIEMNIIANVNE